MRWGWFVPDWFRRFGDIPGVTYAPSEQIDRHSLAGCDDVPEEHEVFPRDRESTTLWWPASGGSRGGSASPVHRRAFSAFRDSRDVPVAAILQNAYEGLG
jgi:hypothetical protein